jgi:hypothetical protein
MVPDGQVREIRREAKPDSGPADVDMIRAHVRMAASTTAMTPAVVFFRVVLLILHSRQSRNEKISRRIRASGTPRSRRVPIVFSIRTGGPTT